MTPTFLSLLIIGAMTPYLFSALTIHAVGVAAEEMISFLRNDLKQTDQENYRPNYTGCINISLNAAITQMILPSCIVICLPILVGIFFGPNAVAGLLIGIIITGIQMAISASNSGGAWDNTKKLIKSNTIINRRYWNTYDTFEMS
jgi:Na+/H+-translocating membrane pyrophosphatase